MNRRERVMASLRHREPDRVPLDLGSTDTTGISGIAYNRLKKYLGLDGTHTRILPVQQIALDLISFLQLLLGLLHTGDDARVCLDRELFHQIAALLTEAIAQLALDRRTVKARVDRLLLERL